MDSEFAFDAPCYTDFGACEQNDNADEWFDGRRCTSTRKAKSSAASKNATPARTRAQTAAKSAKKEASASPVAQKGRKRAREAPIVMPIRSDAPLTIPSTPNVLKKTKLKHTTEAEKFVSVAESVAQFSARTPPRFHVAPTNAKFKPTRTQTRRGVTQAKSPKFQPRRLRARTVMSTEEKEEQLISEIKPFKVGSFPARRSPLQSQPAPKDVLESKGDLGVPRIVSKDVTVPLEFNFATQKRADLWPKTALGEDKPIIFTANPIPAEIFVARPKSAKKSHKPLTVPHTPNLTKPAPRPEPRVEEPMVVEFHAQPMIVQDAVFQPVLQHKHTAAMPFSVADKNPMMTRKRLLEEQLKIEAEQREFKAHGIPSFSPDVRPVSAKPATIPEPFELPGESISKRKKMDFEHKVQKEQIKMKESAAFHAQPCLSTIVPPFESKRSDKALTEMNAFDFQTDKRAVDRSVFDETVREKARLEEEEQERLRKEREEQEKKDLVVLRKSRVIKAQPVRHFKDAAPGKILPLTEPKSPAFSKRFTLRT